MTDMGYLYKVEETEIFVSSRAKRLFPEAPAEDGYPADAYLSVTDTFCSPIKDKIFVWFPWNEGRQPIPEMFYACNKVLSWWVRNHKFPKVQLFCDGGTHRSVTVFGAFLLAYYPKQAKDIVSSRIPVERPNLHEDQTFQSDPLEYIAGYLNDFPEDRLLFKVMGEDGLGRLDDYCKGIYKRVKSRYATRFD